MWVWFWVCYMWVWFGYVNCGCGFSLQWEKKVEEGQEAFEESSKNLKAEVERFEVGILLRSVRPSLINISPSPPLHREIGLRNLRESLWRTLRP